MMGLPARIREAGRTVRDSEDDVVIVVVTDEILCLFMQRFPSIAGIQCSSHSTIACGYQLFDANAADVTPKRQGLRINLILDDRRSRRRRRRRNFRA
ncbi:hypothetical protein Y032_0047g1455 [Ancylostoma ceylanicum]|uniref:Uncharacterized protein n=1 Tax=Ancylostoma ceylanicum TaxID=53326 RepID=A0A016UB39_9BILA|nr:hypothetical protein Y032_0047g1455 [Ancylostoma ceylanicum]